MKKVLLIIFLCACISISCEKEIDPYLITPKSVGMINDSTQVRDLKAIFVNDSITRFSEDDEFTGRINDVEIYSKAGEKLLVLSPTEANDSTAIFNTVRVLDERYKTEKNISILSTFKDINDAYQISKIDNLINSVVVTVNEINASFTIDKKELPSNTRFDNSMTISAIQIPDNAKIKFFMIHW